MLEGTSVLLKRLERTDLALEPTQKVPLVRGPGGAPGAKPSTTVKQAESKLAARHPAKKSEPRDSAGGLDRYKSR